MTAADKFNTKRLVNIFRDFDATGSGVLSCTDLGSLLKALSPDMWTDSQLNTLMSAFDSQGNGFIQYDNFATWVMQQPSQSVNDGSEEEELLRSIQFSSSRGPTALSSMLQEAARPAQEFVSEEALLFATLSMDPPTEPPTRRPSWCEEEMNEPSKTLTLEDGEAANMMTSIRRAASQGLGIGELKLTDQQDFLSEQDLLQATLSFDPPTEPGTRRPSFDEEPEDVLSGKLVLEDGDAAEMMTTIRRAISQGVGSTESPLMSLPADSQVAGTKAAVLNDALPLAERPDSPSLLGFKDGKLCFSADE